MSALRVKYQTIEFGHIDIHVRTLRDRQQFSDPQGVAEDLGISSSLWPIFGMLWSSSLAMSHFLLDYDFQDKSVLEVGCGIGLTSLLLNHLDVDISATDHHPEVESFLEHNVMINGGKDIPFERLDWRDDIQSKKQFDVIIGSDLLYEDDHVFLLADFIDRQAKPHCQVIIVDPGRGRHGKFGRKMEAAGFTFTKQRSEKTDFLDAPFKGWILQYTR
jgi:predicted nicotinamide N-methyase